MRHFPLLLIVVSIAVCADAMAWSPEMEERVVFEATRLMPASLRSIMNNHVDALHEGLQEAAVDEGSAAHTLLLRPVTRGTNAGARAMELATEIVAMVNSHQPFADVARKMGSIAHVVCDLNNPLLVSDDDPREFQYADDYVEYVRNNLDRYPLVFYGWEEETLRLTSPKGDGDLSAFVRQTARRARRYYDDIGRAYSPVNKEPMSRRFDVRSIPFGIGSISYSYSVTDTARVWLQVWRKANGDMSGIPYFRAARPITAPVSALGEKK